ncbi:homeobox protein Mix.2-like [Diadema setosum]|uniref:homeobox protein Mix.2-like n=1 Tax=Diadema setosum TaxID=31175 RepID=UPI003B3B2739
MADSPLSVLPQVSTSVPNKGLRRRRPTVFTEWQLERLKAEFDIDRYPDIVSREKLAASLGLDEDRIQVWFQNRRSRLRRASLNSLSARPDISDKKINRLSDIAGPQRKRKRSTECDVIDQENTPPPKKFAINDSPMSVDFLSRSSRSPDSWSTFCISDERDVINLQQTTSHRKQQGATNPLMSVDFLSRSSRPTSSYPSPYRQGSLHHSPSPFYMFSHPYVFVVPH